eukprot:TRINITY_DN10352_c0_g5_i1.p1 TRINITY_DN10352_c0_g5~~TRINITY_DN10352_c0_g5_i1.p1  ORF type:complete len:265 (+),score=-15.10 TRINITY_DN10352_c0_g5_i1:548-1342(+)
MICILSDYYQSKVFYTETNISSTRKLARKRKKSKFYQALIKKSQFYLFVNLQQQFLPNNQQLACCLPNKKSTSRSSLNQNLIIPFSIVIIASQKYNPKNPCISRLASCIMQIIHENSSIEESNKSNSFCKIVDKVYNYFFGFFHLKQFRKEVKILGTLKTFLCILRTSWVTSVNNAQYRQLQHRQTTTKLSIFKCKLYVKQCHTVQEMSHNFLRTQIPNSTLEKNYIYVHFRGSDKLQEKLLATQTQWLVNGRKYIRAQEHFNI